MKAMPNSGVARLTIGIDTNAAITSPAVKIVAALSRRIALASAGRAKPHRREFEIFASQQPGGRDEECDETGAGNEHEGQRNQIDQHGEQRGLDAFGHGETERQRRAGAFRRIMFAFDMIGDLVDEHARHQRGDRGHQQHRAEHDTEAGGDRNDPCQQVERGMEAGAEHRFGPALAIGRKPAQKPLQADRQHHDQHQRKPDRAPQDRAHRRRQDLRQRLDCGIEHDGLSSLASSRER